MKKKTKRIMRENKHLRQKNWELHTQLGREGQWSNEVRAQLGAALRELQEVKELRAAESQKLQEVQIENTNLRPLVPRDHGGDAKNWSTVFKAYVTTDAIAERGALERQQQEQLEAASAEAEREYQKRKKAREAASN